MPQAVPAETTAKPQKFEDLIRRLTEIRQAMAESEAPLHEKLSCVHRSYLKSARNLAHYLTLRHRDIRPLQQELAELGLSSLGRAEAHVMATLDAVLAAIHGLAGRPSYLATPTLDFQEGNRLLSEHTEALLGPASAKRAVFTRCRPKNPATACRAVAA